MAKRGGQEVILGIETATSICSAGIVDGERLVVEFRFNIPNIHAEVLAENIEHLLRLSGTSLKSIAAFAVSIGPGSFTGLRIGLATAKGLAFASGKPLVTVSTLLAQAAAMGRGQRAESRGHETIIAVIKARQDEIYAARFRSEWPMPIAESDEVLLPLAEFPQWLQTPAVLCGNGVAMLQARGVLEDLRDVIVVPEAAAMLGGGLIARLGAIKLAAGEIADLANLEPRYLQAFETGSRKI